MVAGQNVPEAPDRRCVVKKGRPGCSAGSTDYKNKVRPVAQIYCDKQNGAPGEIRTPDLQLRRLPLYPAELRARTECSQCTCAALPLSILVERNPASDLGRHALSDN